MRHAALMIAMAGGCTPVAEIFDAPSFEADATDTVADADADEDAALEPVDAGLRALGIGPIRTHPLWPTPSNDDCPAVVFGSLGQSLQAGDMFRRIHARMIALAEAQPQPRGVLGVLGHPRMTDIVLVRDHLGVPGLRLVAAMDHSTTCMMSWAHQHCFVTTGAAYCPGDGAAEVGRMVRELGLAPGDLDRAGWFELVVALMDVDRMVLDPDRISACTRVAGAHTVAPEVTIDADRVTVQLTAIENGAGVLHYVVIEASGQVHASRHLLWKAPDEQDVWGTIDDD